MSHLWLKASWLKKEVLIRRTGAYLVQLFGKQFSSMGNIFATYNLQQLPTAQIPNTTLLGSEFRCSDTGTCLSEIVSVPFFSDKLLQANVKRGPFKNSRAWLAAQLQLYIKGADDPIQYEDSESDSDDELDELTTPEAVKSRANLFIALLPKVFSKEVTEEFVLHHSDLNETNIMVDHLNHEITGVIDWKSVQTVPLWQACQRFLSSWTPISCATTSLCPKRTPKTSKAMVHSSPMTRTLRIVINTRRRSCGASFWKKWRVFVQSG
ncbi:hypothetical protein HBI75_043680 [Parastagonospora nodorum]|nr:hypothetical protein HBI75_043680 [Parastagonospora nodorum]KAH5283523.1 hypothetical protein HBI72_007310 [Parastagonospora nodorum]KAH6127419.1 hypothetical protein HBI69_015810 [Parastagonospora nodorum]